MQKVLQVVNTLALLSILAIFILILFSLSRTHQTPPTYGDYLTAAKAKAVVTPAALTAEELEFVEKSNNRSLAVMDAVDHAS